MNTVSEPAARLDLRQDVCPETWVMTKLALDDLHPGDVLELLIGDGETLRSIPRTVKDDGHKVTGVRVAGDTAYVLSVTKGAAG